MVDYLETLQVNRAAYDRKVEERAEQPLGSWKLEEDRRFLARLRAEGCRTLVEIGAGTGVHGKFFHDAGLEVVCTDPSSAMVTHCRAQGLSAELHDVLSLKFTKSFDVAFAMNCLLHVPIEDLPAALDAIAGVLRPGGLFFWGQYGGNQHEGPRDGDHYEPKRFFSSVSDHTMQELAEGRFEIVDFHTVDVGLDDGHFQSLTLRSRTDQGRQACRSRASDMDSR